MLSWLDSPFVRRALRPGHSLAVALEWVIHRSLRPTHLRLTFQPAHWPYTLLLPKYLTWVIMHHASWSVRRAATITDSARGRRRGGSPCEVRGGRESRVMATKPCLPRTVSLL
jgi:hypothetical protein